MWTPARLSAFRVVSPVTPPNSFGSARWIGTSIAPRTSLGLTLPVSAEAEQLPADLADVDRREIDDVALRQLPVDRGLEQRDVPSATLTGPLDLISRLAGSKRISAVFDGWTNFSPFIFTVPRAMNAVPVALQAALGDDVGRAELQHLAGRGTLRRRRAVAPGCGAGARLRCRSCGGVRARRPVTGWRARIGAGSSSSPGTVNAGGSGGGTGSARTPIGGFSWPAGRRWLNASHAGEALIAGRHGDPREERPVVRLRRAVAGALQPPCSSAVR